MVNGAISLWRKHDARDFDSDDLSLLGDVANQIGIALKQFANHEELERLSRTDTLTGLLNRRVFLAEMSRRLADAERTGRGGALCYVDLDNFKSVNDCHGHRRGDHALIAVADILRSHVRESDLVARVGGDEFALWLEKMDEPAATAKMKMLLEAVNGLLQFSGDAAHPLGFSIGIAEFEPGAGEQLDQLMARADEAMYGIKKAGKGGMRFAAAASRAPRVAVRAVR
jgi:diguanylate cyclase (GGDEF)-like protein